MTDDIVTKLEFLLQEGAEIIKEQAAEIERLRTELADWQRTVRALVERIAEETSGYE